jgi:DNA-binding transcriptional LysR family regulator
MLASASVEPEAMSLFDGVEIFVQVVDSGSFTAAGEALGMAKSSVSEAVRRVEERLNVRLLDRTTRRLAPTEAGRTYYDHARRAMEQARIARSAARALALEPAGRLRVAAPENFERLIMPALPAIFEALPGVEIEFVGGPAFVDLIEAGIDVAIRVAQQPAENLIVRKLGVSRVAILAAPAYLEKFGAPQSPHDVAAHRCIGFSPLFWGREWRFIGPEGSVSVPIRPIMLCNSSNALREAALNGLGLTTLPSWVVDEELASGRLVEVLKDWMTPESGVYAVYPSNRMITPKVRRFVEAIAARMRDL